MLIVATFRYRQSLRLDMLVLSFLLSSAMSMSTVEYIPIRESMTEQLIAFRHWSSCSRKDSAVAVLFCNGFRSKMTNGRKIEALSELCMEPFSHVSSFTTFDYRGHGLSKTDHDFTELTLSDWIEDTLTILDHVVLPRSPGCPVLLVGSSMGAWIALHVCLQRSAIFGGVIGIAAAPDFTEDLWNELSYAEQAQMSETGVIYRPSQYSDELYPISMKLIEDGRKWSLLSRMSTPLPCPIHLIHGQRDIDVPFQRSMKLAERIDSRDVSITLIKQGDHRLSTPSDLTLLATTVQHMIEKIRAATSYAVAKRDDL
jgi:pimeloyl-ACP methyl ester carboxylesterase